MRNKTTNFGLHKTLNGGVNEWCGNCDRSCFCFEKYWDYVNSFHSKCPSSWSGTLWEPSIEWTYVIKFNCSLWWHCFLCVIFLFLCPPNSYSSLLVMFMYLLLLLTFLVSTYLVPYLLVVANLLVYGSIGSWWPIINYVGYNRGEFTESVSWNPYRGYLVWTMKERNGMESRNNIWEVGNETWFLF